MRLEYKLREVHSFPQVDVMNLDRFTRSPLNPYLETKFLMEQVASTNMVYEKGLVIGRFQPLHYGHILLIKQAICHSKSLVVGIGSANVRNADNPFSFSQRRKMVEEALMKEGIQEFVARIVPLNDYSNDELWLSETLRRTGKVDVVVGNNDWVNDIFMNAHIPTKQVPLFQRGIYEGKKIRQQLRIEGKLN